MDKKAERRQNYKDFFRGFLATMLVMLPVFVGIQLVISHGRAGKDDSLNVLDPVEGLPVTKAESYNLLWVLEESGSKNLLSVALIRFDVVHYRAVVCNIPDTTVLLEARAPVSMSSLYSQRGILGIKSALQETLEIPIDGYAGFNTDMLEKLVDTLGDFEYTLDKELVVKNAAGLTIYTKQAGNVTLNGNDIAKLINFGNYEAENLMRLHEGLWQAALNKYGSAGLGDQLAEAYTGLVDRITTDINPEGVYHLTTAITAASVNSKLQIEIVRPQGNFRTDRFELAEGADEQLWGYFGRLSNAG